MLLLTEITWLPTTALIPSLLHSCLTSSAIEVNGTTKGVVDPEVQFDNQGWFVHQCFRYYWGALCNHIHILLKANTRWQEQAGDQHRDGLAISCGHAAQYMATIGAINGSGSNVDLKLNIFHGFFSQDKGQPHYVLWTTNVLQFSEALFFIIQVFLGMSLGLISILECWVRLVSFLGSPKSAQKCQKMPKIT